MRGVSNKMEAKNSLQALSYKALKGFKGFEYKKCPFCGSKQIKKNGCRNARQCYKCHTCDRQLGGNKRLNPQALF